MEHLQIRIINTNFRPITITGVGGRLMTKDKRRWVLKEVVPANAFVDIPKPDFPVTLKDGDSMTVKLQSVMLPYFWNKEEQLDVFAYDAEGVTYQQTDKKTYNAKFSRYED